MEKKRAYRFGESQLTIVFGDITTSKAQVLVSSDDYYISMGGGVSAAILNAGGIAISLDAAKKVPVSVADVVVTTAGALPAQYIFHAVTIGPYDAGHEAISQNEIITRITKRCMQMLDSLQLRSIAFPALGTGVAGFDYVDVAVSMAAVIADDLLVRQRPIEVMIYLFDRFGRMSEIDFVRFFEEFAVRVPHLANHQLKKQMTPESVAPSVQDGVTETAQEIKMRRINNVRKLMSSLENQRFSLEERLIDLQSTSGDAHEVANLRQKLRENESLRLNYLNELRTISGQDASSSQLDVGSKKALTVFVSSTYKDLHAYRAAVIEQIIRRDMHVRGMEYFGADPNRVTPADKIVDDVRKADIYLGIFGVRYGSIDEATGLSMTELEYNEAETSNKPMLTYVIRDDASVQVSDIESNLTAKAKLDDLKVRVLQKHTAYRFNTIEDLSRQVYEDLGKVMTNDLSKPSLTPI
ncbi:MAG TPA: DUF4062 domain-containing protein [Chloroflexia bacterium]|nr:DUF4062 domain-containing protein [Chloroflexia bacterium]